MRRGVATCIHMPRLFICSYEDGEFKPSQEIVEAAKKW